MLRLMALSLCLVLLSGPGTSAFAQKRGLGATPDKGPSLSDETPVASQKPEVAEIKEMLKKGRALENANKKYHALPLYQQALQRSEKAMGPEHPLTAACMARLAKVYSMLGFFGQALPLAQKSLKIREKALGPEHPQTAQSLMILGTLHGQMGAHDQALQMNQQALRISEKALGPEHWGPSPSRPWWSRRGRIGANPPWWRTAGR